jgi:adenylate cyclase
MNISPQLKINLRQIGFITIYFVVFNLFLAFFNHVMIGSMYSLGPSEAYDFKVSIFINVLVGVIAGVLGGTVLVTVNTRILRKKSFGYAMISTAIAYVIVFILAAIINTSVLLFINLENSLTLTEFVDVGLEVLINSTTLSYFIMWFFVTLFTLFFLQVNDKFGQGVLLKFLMGNYHTPKEEERIFMFADMRSSTTIAEKLGNRAYFNLLYDMFADITSTILDHGGEIYQYVGDEIVISWPLKKGVKNANCLNCYFDIQAKLAGLSDFYLKKYGIRPELKAGLHHGEVMAGEIGIIKKDIIYSGDVLNTTSRIQEQCNTHQVDVLISNETFEILEDTLQFELVPIGHIELRGKQQLVNISTVRN